MLWIWVDQPVNDGPLERPTASRPSIQSHWLELLFVAVVQRSKGVRGEAPGAGRQINPQRAPAGL